MRPENAEWLFWCACMSAHELPSCQASAVKNARPSSSAQIVALARAHLSWMGVLDDRWAETMLRPPWAVVHRFLHLEWRSGGPAL